MIKKCCFLIFFGFFSIVSAGTWIVKEEYISPEIAQFDCHSSSIVEVEPGLLIAVWKGGPGEGRSNIEIKNNVGIWSARCEQGIWSEPEEIVSLPDSVVWNPILCRVSPTELLLFYRVGPDPRRVAGFLKRSFNAGLDWSAAEVLPAGILGPTKNPPLIAADGTWICGSSMEVGEPEADYKATACWIEISKDAGAHWQKIGPLELPHRKFGAIEPALFWDAEGNVKMLCRDRAHRIGETGYIWEAISLDGGLHWSEFQRTDLPNPDAAIHALALGGGEVILFYNHSHTKRSPLNCTLSLNGGKTWSVPLDLAEKGEFASSVLTADGRIHVTYAAPLPDSKQRRIKHVVLDPFQLKVELNSCANPLKA